MSEVLENAAASWPEVFVSDVSELIRGVTYSKEHATDKPQDGYTPVLRATNIQESRLVLESDLVFVPDSNVSANQRLRAGDIVVATSSGSKHLVGKSGLVHADWRGSFGVFCAAIRPKANIELKLTLFHGHLTFMERGVRDAQIKAAVPGGVSPTDHRAGPCWQNAGRAFA